MDWWKKKDNEGEEWKPDDSDVVELKMKDKMRGFMSGISPDYELAIRKDRGEVTIGLPEDEYTHTHRQLVLDLTEQRITAALRLAGWILATERHAPTETIVVEADGTIKAVESCVHCGMPVSKEKR